MRHRKALASVAALATVAGGALMASAPAVNAGPNTGPSLTPTNGGELVRGSDGSVHAFLPSTPLANPLSASSSPASVAKAFLQSRASEFGAKASSLTATQTRDLGATGSTVKFQQDIDGTPVLGGELVVSLDAKGNLQSITGETVSGSFAPSLGMRAPGSTSNAKQLRQVNTWVKKAFGVSDLNITRVGESVVNPALIGMPNGLDANIKTNRYLVQNENGTESYSVFVNDKLGVVTGFSNNPHGNARQICDAHSRPLEHYIPDAMCYAGNSNVTIDRKEGQGKTGDTDVDKVYDFLGYTQLAYANYSGIDATKLIGYSDKEIGIGSSSKKLLRATVHYTPDGAPYENAFWSNIVVSSGGSSKVIGGQMWYGEGVTEDDISAHELSHGVTAETSNLMYQFQSGAINESMSDVFGEIVDLTDQNYGAPKESASNAWLMGEGSSLGVIRSLKNPPAYEQPDKMTSQYWADLPGGSDYDQGGVHYNSGVGNKAGYLIAHGGSFNGQTVKGLGYAKTWAIYWTAQNLLTSGADYKDLFTTLQVACQKNIGNKYITKADCAQVKKAVVATEMYKNAKGTYVPVATPYCPSGKRVKATAVYGFDHTPSGWSGVVLAKRDAKVDYVNTGNDAAFVNNKKLTFTKGVKVPSNGLLRIDYAVMDSSGYYGTTGKGSLAWSTTGTGGWHNLAPTGSVNPSKWGQTSGWSSAKMNLKRWAGKTLYFRFDTSSDNTALFVDNFKVYNCQ